MRYRVTFDRIGRNHHPDALETEADDMDQLAERIHVHARPHLLSSDVEVTTDRARHNGYIHAGFHTAGSFTFEEITDHADTRT